MSVVKIGPVLERRALIAGLATLAATPAIVKALGLMKVAPTETYYVSNVRHHVLLTDFAYNVDVAYGVLTRRPVGLG